METTLESDGGTLFWLTLENYSASRVTEPCPDLVGRSWRADSAKKRPAHLQLIFSSASAQLQLSFGSGLLTMPINMKLIMHFVLDSQECHYI